MVQLRVVAQVVFLDARPKLHILFDPRVPKIQIKEREVQLAKGYLFIRLIVDELEREVYLFTAFHVDVPEAPLIPFPFLAFG